MNNPTFEDISVRAYHLWEERGRPDDQQSSIDCWLQAEHELWDKAREGREDESESFDDRGDRDGERSSGRREIQGGRFDGAEEGSEQGEADITNLDRALPPNERRKARDTRQGKNDQTPYADGVRPEHFLVLVNLKHVRIYENMQGVPHLAHSADPSQGQQGYSDNDTDQAGRFGKQRGKGRVTGASIDERLPMLEEQQRRVAKEAADHIAKFLQDHPKARWSYAAGPMLHQMVLDHLPKGLRARIDHNLTKDLLNVPLPELVGHFAHHV